MADTFDRPPVSPPPTPPIGRGTHHDPRVTVQDPTDLDYRVHALQGALRVHEGRWLRGPLGEPEAGMATLEDLLDTARTVEGYLRGDR